MKVMCPGCEQKLATKDEYAGKRVKCPQCGELFRLPKPEGVTREIPVTSLLFEDENLVSIHQVPCEDVTDTSESKETDRET